MATQNQAYEGPPAPNGFQFNPGEFIPTAPDVFPGEEVLIQLSELAMEYGTGWVAAVALIVFVILELINFLVLIFTGKPRELDTITVAHRLSQSNNPAGHLASVLILRELNDENVVLSASDPFGMDRVNATRHQLVMSLVAQGTPITRAKTLAGNIWGNTTSPTEPLPLELRQPLDSKYTLIGPKSVQDAYTREYNDAIQAGKDPLQAAHKATKWIYNHSLIKDLLQIQTRQQPQGPPPPPPQCPTGQHWDAALQQCVPDTTIPPPPPPNPNGDELSDCCQLTATYLYAIAVAIQGFTPAQMDTGCCDKVVAAINAVAAALATAGGNAGNVNITIDTTPIADAIAKLIIPPPVVNVTVQPDETPDPNVKRIADDMDALATIDTTVDPFIKQMESDGLLKADLAQLIGT